VMAAQNAVKVILLQTYMVMKCVQVNPVIS
jgi:hypothetical protein